jgi:hypothetical protein
MAWKHGQSGNAAGGTKGAGTRSSTRSRMAQNVAVLARTSCRKALEVVQSILVDTDVEAATRIAAAKVIFERGIGRVAEARPIESFSDEELFNEMIARREHRADETANRPSPKFDG